jgi:hypothetical protein
MPLLPLRGLPPQAANRHLDIGLDHPVLHIELEHYGRVGPAAQEQPVLFFEKPQDQASLLLIKRTLQQDFLLRLSQFW